MLRTLLLAALIITTLFFVNACGMLGLYKDLEILNNELTIISGEVTVTDDIDGNIIAVVYQQKDNHIEVIDFDLMLTPGRFYFGIEKGDHHLIAFNDKNQDLAWQKNEPIISITQPINAQTATDPYTSPYPLLLAKGNPHRIQWNGTLPLPTGQSEFVIDHRTLGTITTFSNPAFSFDNATLGMWRPVTFIENIGFGFYSLQPFDNKKIPVVLVHGIGGTPLNWKTYVENMNSEQYQFVMYHYPSGLDLWLVSWYLAELIEDMIALNKTNDIYIVAHSMGGLVSAGAILELHEKKLSSHISKFLSISTPWKGHESAQFGKDYAPVVMPVWNDMVPDSEFVRMLNQHWLPPNIDYGLVFSTSGESLTSLKNNDGSVTLESQLSWVMQEQAIMVRGIDRNHTGILEDARLPKLSEALFNYNRLKKQRALPAPSAPTSMP